MRDRVSTERGVPTHQAVRSLIIVAREQQDLWRSLVHEFQDVERIQVLLDRRHGERRTPRGAVAYDRRARERRSLPLEPRMPDPMSRSGDPVAIKGEAGERFRCPRCNYTRPIRPNEDGFQLYLQHKAYCPLAGGEQLWLPILQAERDSLAAA
jgi:hypothetical protein